MLTLAPVSGSNLSWLRGKAEEAILVAENRAKNELEDFGSIAQDQYGSAFGFPMKNVAETKRFLQQIQLIADHAAKASRFCAEIGITPLAILPTSAWKESCVKAGLFTLKPSKDSMARVSLQKLSAAISKASSSELAPKKRSWLFSNEQEVATSLEARLRVLRQEAVTVRKYFAESDQRKLAQDLFPEYVELTHGGHTTKVLFPAPPVEVGKVLHRLNGKVDLSVTLQCEALSFPELEPDLLAGIEERIADAKQEAIIAIRARAEQERLGRQRLEQLARQRELEPIITFVIGEVTVLAAQYGPWVIEQCVIEECITRSLSPSGA